MKSIRKIHDLRSNIHEEFLLEKNLPASPLLQFDRWMKKAIESGNAEPTAMALGTTDSKGNPSARIVLLKGYDENGFVFFTNYKSKKANELKANPSASIVFYWSEIHKQIRIEGKVKPVSAKESDEYFQSRPRESQIGAVASSQSKVAANRKTIEERFEFFKNKFAGKKITRPEGWGGYRLVPDYFEFWQGRHNRLHDRIVFKKANKNRWKIFRLYP
ncbi:MAG: pyridoxamine 5'-phosphate oxidase [Bacteroidia bacterium]|nr:pyridoxamine 5'-phosphate oxidase [Bacteroidia bacterium]